MTVARTLPLMVIFSHDPPRPDCRGVELGPYRTAQIAGDLLWVFNGYQPLRLAVRGADGWTVNGMEGLAFSSVLFMPPPDQADEDLDEAERLAGQDERGW